MLTLTIMIITHLPQQERPREKLFNKGADHLSDAELLAIVLRVGTRGKDAVTLSRELLEHYGGLQGLFQANFQSLKQHKGIGMTKFAQIQAAAELNRRYMQEPIQRQELPTTSNDIREYLLAELRGYEQEVFACLFLDINLRLIRFEKLFTGTFNMAVVYPREVARRALGLNAAAIIAAHNHPSGNISPSQADQRLTKHMVKALELVGIQLLDHVIVSGNRTLSFSEQGYL